ncbi:MAG: ABC transporter permease [Ilumatobacter sp.]|nr:MAG: ABC transporter permease [Ilumatobacter sp.]
MGPRRVRRTRCRRIGRVRGGDPGCRVARDRDRDRRHRASPCRVGGAVSAVGAARAVARVELARIVRDRTGMAFIVVLPVLVIIVIGSSIGSVSGSARIGVLDLDRTTASSVLIDDLDTSDHLEVVLVDDLESLTVDVRLDRIRLGVVIPAGHADRLAAGTTSEIELVLDPSRATAAAARNSVAGVVDRHAAVVAATAFAADLTGADPDTVTRAAGEIAADVAPVRVETEDVGTGGIDAGSPFSYPAAANLVLFTFINTLAVGGALVESRRLGVTRRMLAGPVSPSAVIGGYAASRFLVAIGQGLLVIVAGALLFDVEWGSPVAVALLVITFSIVAAAVGVLVGAVARTPEQTQSIGIPVGIAMGMLGGALWPLQFVPDWLRQLGHITPHAWAMDGWVTVVFENGGVRDIAVELAVLTIYGLVVAAFAVAGLRRAVTRA